MIIKLLPICYDPSHQPFSGSQAANCQTVDSEKPASKLIRAVLRVSEIDPNTWSQYSIHRCYCNSKGKRKEEIEDELDSTKTLDQLGIKEGDSIFFRKRNERMEEEEVEEDQDEEPLPRTRKRKERDEDEAATQSSLLAPAPTPKTKLENLEPYAAAAAGSISKLLGGDAWKTQSVGKLGLIQTKGDNALQCLQRAIKTSLQIHQVATAEAGFFNSDLVEALTRAYHQRVGSSIAKKGDKHFFDLGPYDYEQANELLKGKIEGNGSWERSSISHLDESALSKPEVRFPLTDSGLSGKSLNAARAICVLWNNDQWLNQSPMPGLSPISLKSHKMNALLRQIAELTRVRPGEATPAGFPPIVLKVLRESIKKNKEAFDSNNRSSKGGWTQKRNLEETLALLKKRVAPTSSIASSGSDLSSEASGSRDDGKRNVRPRLNGGK